jgi:molybdopterin-containing oxidoreductase family iron-sulfur binding subunit
VPLRAHLGLYDDETALLCHWHVPEAHYLESWGDVRAHDGTVSLAPAADRAALRRQDGDRGARRAARVRRAERLRRRPRDVARDAKDATDFETFWERRCTTASCRARRGDEDGVRGGRTARRAEGADGLEVVFQPDPYMVDGRFANNGWLQELPHPITKLVWDNAAFLAPATAERLGVASGDVVELARGDAKLRIPAWIVPGHARTR